MTRVLILLPALLLLAAAEPPEDSDLSVKFPSLQTTIVDPQADKGPLTWCAELGGRRQCEEGLAEAWCKQNGFAEFIRWTTAGETDPVACLTDDKACAIVTTITCGRAPII